MLCFIFWTLTFSPLTRMWFEDWVSNKERINFVQYPKRNTVFVFVFSVFIIVFNSLNIKRQRKKQMNWKI